MRDQLITLGSGERIAAGIEASGRAWLELTTAEGPVRVALAEGEALMTIEALAMLYAELCGARPDSAARGVNRTLRNRTAAARGRRRGGEAAAA
jgi:hypothetical protein